MPRKPKELSPVQIKRLGTKPGLHAAGGVTGLYLQVTPRLSTSWILRIKIGGKRVDLGLGGYPTVELARARATAREYRELIRQGIDPRERRRAALAALRAAEAKRLTFDEAAEAAHKARASGFKNAKHSAQWIGSLKTYASPVVGSLSVDQVELAHVVKILEPIWATKTETATRVRQRIEAVLAWATVAEYRTGDNPARWKGHLEHALAKPSKVRRVKHHKALSYQDVPAFMVELRKQNAIAAKALQFTILTAARSGEVRLAKWDEIDLDAKLWTVPADRMKAGKVHRVPLSNPAVELLKTLPRILGSEYVFSSAKGRPLSDMALSEVCRRMKVAAVPHGFRSSFKDWARSSTSYPDEVSELALAHVSSDATRAAYARDELLPKRIRLMRDWATFCGTAKPKADVTPIRGRKHG